MTEHACEERRPSGGGGWRGLCGPGGPGLKCAVFFPDAVTFPRRIIADSRRGVNETCAPAPAEVTARKERWRDCVQGHVSTAATTARQWRDIVVKGDSITNPRSLEREEENCKTQDPDVQIEQRKIPIEALYPNTAHAKPNAASPNSSKSIAEEFVNSTVNYPYATDTSSIIGEHNFADVKHPNCVPLFTTHQASLSTDYKRPAHEYLGAMQQSVSLNAYPFRYKRDPYVGQGDLCTNVYPCTESDSGVTEETSCTALKSHTIAWDNCGTRLHGVHSACDPPSAHEKHARSPEADLDMDSYIENVKSNMREIMPSMDFQLLQRSRSQSPNAVSSQSSSLTASPQRSDSGQSDNSNAALLCTRRTQASSSSSSFSKSMKANECISVSKSVERTKEPVNQRLQSSVHKRCRRQSSLSSRSRSQSPLTHTYQSRNNHLIKRNRNSSRSSRSRSRSPRKNDRQLHHSSVSRKRSPSSTTSQSSSRSSSSCRKAHHGPHYRSRKHYTRKWTGQSSCSSRFRTSRSSQSRGSRSPRPRGSRSPRPRGSRSPRPRGSRSPRPRGSRSPRPRGSCSARPRGSRSPRPRGSRSPRPRGSRSPRPRGSRSPRPRGSRSPRPRGSRSSQPRSSSSSRSRSLTPHSKGRHSSQIQKSPSTSTHPMGSSESSDEDTTQRKFGVKVQFHKPELDDKRVKENIFRLFHKFGFVTYVKIIHSGSERFAVVYFSRLYEQQAAIYGSNSFSLRDALHVSLWTGEEKDEQYKRDDTPPKATQAKLSQIKLVSDFCGPNIFWENNIALHPSSSRTLFIGKLPKTIAPAKLDMICEKFENIVDIEVEQTPGENTCSALIEFSDIVSLINTGKVLDRNFFGIDGVKLGFAEMKPTNCLWVDGLPPRLTSAKLMAHFAAYGPTAKLLRDRLLCRALILYKQREDALFAVKQTKLRQVKVFGNWLMLDFASDRSQLAFCQSMLESGQNAGNFLHE